MFYVMPQSLADIGKIRKAQRGYNEEDERDSYVRAVVHTGLVGWRGVLDAAGNEIEFSPDLVDKLPRSVGLDLFNSISRVSNKEAEKNVDGPRESAAN